jgi:hypothetical protein
MLVDIRLAGVVGAAAAGAPGTAAGVEALGHPFVLGADMVWRGGAVARRREGSSSVVMGSWSF